MPHATLFRWPYMSLTGSTTVEYVFSKLSMASVPQARSIKAKESPISSTALSARAHQCTQMVRGTAPNDESTELWYVSAASEHFEVHNPAYGQDPMKSRSLSGFALQGL